MWRNSSMRVVRAMSEKIIGQVKDYILKCLEEKLDSERAIAMTAKHFNITKEQELRDLRRYASHIVDLAVRI